MLPNWNFSDLINTGLQAGEYANHPAKLFQQLACAGVVRKAVETAGFPHRRYAPG